MVPIACRASMRWGNFCWTWSLVNHLPWWRSWPSLTTRYSWILCLRVFLTCMSMTWLVVVCSMQFRLSSVGVSCSAILYVSNNGGKYGWRCSTLNTGCKPRNGKMLSSKSPTTLVMVYGHIRVGEACSGVQWGTPSTNVAKLCCLLGTCAALDADHGATYT